MKEYSVDELPQRNEYVIGGFVGVRHIVVNYHKDGSVTRTTNGIEENYATQKDFHDALEEMYQYSEWLDNWNSKWTITKLLTVLMRNVFCWKWRNN